MFESFVSVDLDDSFSDVEVEVRPVKRRRSRKRRSIVHKYFEFDDEDDATCTLCKGPRKATFKYKSTTTSMLSHLRKVHGISPPDATQTTLSHFAACPKQASQEDVTLSFLCMIVRDMRPLGLGDTPSFRAFLKVLQTKLPFRRQLTQYILGGYDVGKDVMRKKLEEANGVALTFDGWTSLAHHSYIGMTVHYVDESFSLQHGTLRMWQVKGSHTGLCSFLVVIRFVE
jgi:hypothetical protein